MRRDPDPLMTAEGRPDNRATGERDPYLTHLGERIRSLRAARGMSRKDLARGADVSERYLANLETGTGNASVLLLRQVANALDVPLPVVLAEVDGHADAGGAGNPRATEFSQLIQWLAQLPASDLARVREAARHALSPTESRDARHRRIALIGLRGAGKSTLGRALAAAEDMPFVELNAAIEREAGASLSEIHSLYGQAAYRRYEMRALERVLRENDTMVLATPGSLVSEPATFNLLLSRCFTIWVRTSPEEHMARVVAQGDMRPMEGNREAMTDLRRILQARTPLYSRADATIDTSGQDAATSLHALQAQILHTRA
ncbi:helix-turn-helix transcriptional regulator [Cupriavidus metallidurans]|uniref:Shikimate kinase n=1 Tax=Cupriavidus metallidurans (strain ATCC 43123 / DSM 2839 / NBRC 102507 / CH34) TaxID=266264 RepID=Q1LP17_CUPMC|nr:transcriptional regulator, XRE family with shikimate kinase activity [Cupriavidus metallidurans CH34]QGS27617.1 helix-turn-helix domain-containing protein [Cupriavidus metallidurans]